MALMKVSHLEVLRRLVNKPPCVSMVYIRVSATPNRTFCRCSSLQQKNIASESEYFQDNCKKIGAVVTRAATGNSSPIVAILGWNSAQDKHLEKYSEIFERKSFDTIRISANPFNTFMFLYRVKGLTQRLLDLLVEMKSDQNRAIILYSFSMGGFNVYHFINQAMSTPGHKHFNSIRVVGCIFDSCPHFPGLQSIRGAQSSVVETIPNPLIKGLTWLGLGIASPFVFLLSSHVKHLIPDNITSPMGCPELFLYSDTDPLVPEDNVKTFMDAHQKIGIKVFSKLMEGSGHVQHYKNYPEEYLKQINTYRHQDVTSNVVARNREISWANHAVNFNSLSKTKEGRHCRIHDLRPVGKKLKE
ncbi:transmembrane protein 53-like isoform X4 [Montipora capricornis]|uniref:transmembrane protein 53-like isoform X4 n=1 Tax=Montipora capricornis TaxID=246305 RepID=UPI0035F1D308